MTRIAILGLGVIGRIHLAAYAAIADARVVAILTRDPDRLLGTSGGSPDVPTWHGNIPGLDVPVTPPAGVRLYTELHELLKDPEVDVVDVCLPTDQHHIAAISSVLAGKHVIVEKPAGRRSGSVQLLAKTAREAGVLAMPAMCMRFWPGWTWLKEMVVSEKYGRLTALHLRRLCSFPNTPFHRDADRSGGAILDLHLHDTDFVCHLLGVPTAVSSVGRSMVTEGIDYVLTQYDYGGDQGAPVVTALSSWAMADGFPFSMQYTATFELPGGDRTTAFYDINGAHPLTVFREGKPIFVKVPQMSAYEAELTAFLECVRTGRNPDHTMESAADAISVVEAERTSVLSAGRSTAVHGGRLSLMV